ncbi:MAG: pyridoxal phosphate-dependent aminotransferase [Firmicutes bacterium]|nr:pyridoxal phosphate-dependent aminotransferase [Bacillota bacterium]
MKYDFDQIVERRQTYSVKYDMQAYGKAPDLLPMWIADMDFKAPPCVEEALLRQCNHGIFGYSESDSIYFTTMQKWFKNRHDWHIEQEWLVKTPGIVNAIHVAILSLTEFGESVLIQPPVYHPFAAAVQKTGRSLAVNELVYDNGYYKIDFTDFEQKIVEQNVKMFILCNPHNPVGRVWKRAELRRMGEICLKYGVIVVADEIHQDFLWDNNKHLVFTDIDPAYKDITITCTAPSKTFNIAGLQISNIFIANAVLREKFKLAYERMGLGHVNVMGIAACQAVYENGLEWLLQLLEYLAGNMAFIDRFLKERLPQIKLVKAEGTYVAWLDFISLGLDADELDALLTNKARLWLNRGDIFGAGGAGFQRLNTACPRFVLQQAMEKLEKAIIPFLEKEQKPTV